jgi:hypothetical protein
MNGIVAAGLILGSLAALSIQAMAAPQCAAREKILESLGQEFKENRSALGLSGQSIVFELFVSARGTWTITGTDTQGLTCIVAVGEAWQTAPKQLAGLGS